MSGQEIKIEFGIGLAMAGAISAGAYSGGVFDFLCEALTQWQEERKKNPETVPDIDVSLRVISGASAGALTGAVGIIGLAKGVCCYRPGMPDHVLPALYDAWVEKIDLAAASGPDLLQVSDLGSGSLQSLLDAGVLTDIAKATVAAAVQNPVRSPPYSWMPDPLPFYAMVTDLRGIPYAIDFSDRAGGEKHVMQSHGSRRHFHVTNLGDGCSLNWFTKADAVDASFDARTDIYSKAELFVTSALASSAFPVALSRQRIDANPALYDSRMWPSIRDVKTPCLRPDWQAGYPAKGAVLSYNALDGGIIDNEPFEYAHAALTGDSDRAHNKQGGSEADRAVIMIDPFPEAPAFNTDRDPPPISLFNMGGQLITALKNQARFKPDEVAAAADPGRYSRFLIAPNNDKAVASSKLLATGLLGGFGGFLDRSFRAYDYQLGRRNCQRFLMEHFTLPKNNPLIGQRGNKMLQYDDKQDEVRIIPLYGTADPATHQVMLLSWPQIGWDRVQTILKRMGSRADAVLEKLLGENIGGVSLRWLARRFWRNYGRSKLLDQTAPFLLLAGLIEGNQIAEFANGTDALSRAKRAIALALCEPGIDYCTRRRLLGVAGGNNAILDDAIGRIGGVIPIWQGNVAGSGLCYCWASRRPGWIARNLCFVGNPVVAD